MRTVADRPIEFGDTAYARLSLIGIQNLSIAEAKSQQPSQTFFMLLTGL